MWADAHLVNRYMYRNEYKRQDPKRQMPQRDSMNM